MEALRADLNANRNQPKLTLLPFFMQAMVKLSEFPSINAIMMRAKACSVYRHRHPDPERPDALH